MMEGTETRTARTTRPLVTWLVGRLAEVCAVLVAGYTVVAAYEIGVGYASIEPVVWRVGVAGALCLVSLVAERRLGGRGR